MAEDRLEIVMQVIAGRSIKSVATENGIQYSLVSTWVRKYKIFGYNGLVAMKKGRPARNPEMKKMNYNNPRKPKETEYEELIRLRAENEYIKTEIAVIKKEIALREEKQAALLKAISFFKTAISVLMYSFSALSRINSSYSVSSGFLELL